jgi:hypothetical protein
MWALSGALVASQLLNPLRLGVEQCLGFFAYIVEAKTTLALEIHQRLKTLSGIRNSRVVTRERLYAISTGRVRDRPCTRCPSTIRQVPS